MESDLFEGVDELEKSQFLGNFFHWMRNVFTQVRRADVTPLAEKDAEMRSKPVELEPIVATEQALQIKDNVSQQRSQHEPKKSTTNSTLVQNKNKAKNKKQSADFNEQEKLKRRRDLLGDDLSSEKARPRAHPKSLLPSHQQKESAEH